MGGYYWRTDRIARRWFHPAVVPLISAAARLGLGYPLTVRLVRACHYRYSTYRWVP